MVWKHFQPRLWLARIVHRVAAWWPLGSLMNWAVWWIRKSEVRCATQFNVWPTISPFSSKSHFTCPSSLILFSQFTMYLSTFCHPLFPYFSLAAIIVCLELHQPPKCVPSCSFAQPQSIFPTAVKLIFLKAKFGWCHLCAHSVALHIPQGNAYQGPEGTSGPTPSLLLPFLHIFNSALSSS